MAPGTDGPAWTAGGTYLVARTIRQHVEFWDRVGMLEEEQMIGRERVSGAPLGGTGEFQDPRYDLDQGLMFIAFNQDPAGQFATIQRRLEAEPMTDYIPPVGGGYFFVAAGASGPGDWVGSALAAA